MRAIMSGPPLRTISLRRDRIADWHRFPFSIPAIQSLASLELAENVVFFAGENGSGKSTLIEAIALACGFGNLGGTRHVQRVAPEASHDAGPQHLADALRLSWSRKLTQGYFLRAESFFNVASYLDEVQRDDSRTLLDFGGVSLHSRSHGEAFLALVRARFKREGIYLLDEPEAALSPQRQLVLLLIMHELLTSEPFAQFIIATHSPILLAYPGAQIWSFDGGAIAPTTYRETEAFRVTSGFLANPDAYLRHLLTPT